MNDEHAQTQRDTRRRFLTTAAATIGAATVVRVAKAESSIPKGEKVNTSRMPMIEIKGHKISRLVMGANPHFGGAHRGRLLSQLMKEWYTPARIVETLHHAERCGITTWQTGIGLNLPDIWRQYRDEGGRMDLIVLVHPFKEFDLPGRPTWSTGGREAIVALKPLALVQHGNVTDDLWRAGKQQEIRDIIQRHRDEGTLVGCSSHQPTVIKKIADAGWDVDFFMTCFYQQSKKRDQWKAEYGFTPMHEMYTEEMPDAMTDVTRYIEQPCFGFKILAAGRIDRQPAIENAFKYALNNIKKSDGIIVGMFPKFSDQISENANFVIKHGQVV
jgi:hypothetical protein